jgi:hypothetical protein
MFGNRLADLSAARESLLSKLASSSRYPGRVRLGQLVCVTCLPCDRHITARMGAVQGIYCSKCGTGMWVCWAHGAGIEPNPDKRRAGSA